MIIISKIYNDGLFHEEFRLNSGDSMVLITPDGRFFGTGPVVDIGNGAMSIKGKTFTFSKFADICYEKKIVAVPYQCYRACGKASYNNCNNCPNKKGA